ncbi:MAG TPA: GH32 C-terminal domain-containing protein, partial [Candidatus Pelethocola excrementipullorum]|nr:GH32 C-terminal domain-containing protein [Candidatus Pelethocola excrementipullorum]
LINTEHGYRIAAVPFGLDKIRTGSYPVWDGSPVLMESFGLKVAGTHGRIILENQKNQKVTISITSEEIIVDRSCAGAQKFSEKFGSEIYSVAQTRRLAKGDVKMDVLFDVSYLEVFADEGLETASMVVYPDAPYQTLIIEGDLRVEMFEL